MYNVDNKYPEEETERSISKVSAEFDLYPLLARLFLVTRYCANWACTDLFIKYL